MPSGYEATIGSRPLKGSATLTTLNLSADSKNRTQFLVVLTALGDKRAVAPQVTFTNGLLRIRSQGKSWDIRVSDGQRVNDPAAPLMTVVER